MRELAEACFEGKECLVCSTEWADVVLVPRSPTVALEGEAAGGAHTVTMQLQPTPAGARGCCSRAPLPLAPGARRKSLPLAQHSRPLRRRL